MRRYIAVKDYTCDYRYSVVCLGSSDPPRPLTFEQQDVARLVCERLNEAYWAGLNDIKSGRVMI